MKEVKLLAVVLCISLIIVSMAGCGGSENPGAEGGETGGKPSDGQNASETPGSSVETGISVTPPPGWELHEGAGLLVGYLNNGASFFVTRDALPLQASTPDQFIEFVKGNFAETFANTEFGAVQTLQVAGHESRKLYFTGEIFGVRMKNMVVYVFRNGYAYTLTCGNGLAEFAETEGDFQAFIDSFQFK
jgi:hypothetical protein